jgi:hypothetical protein
MGMRRQGDSWTSAESAALRKLAALGISRVEAARRLGRHASTISVRARRAGLKWTPPPAPPKSKKAMPAGPSARPWTDEDDRMLKQLAAGGVPIGVAANRIDRRYNTVLKHARRLGLKFARWTRVTRPSG